MASTDSPHALTTYSGRSLDLDAPSPDDVSIEDAAAALSKICRFGAQARSFYSVAQHAIEVAAHVPPELKLAALHHDSHEAFACDLPTPLKKLIRADSDVYDQLCSRLDAAIGAAFGIDPAAFKDPAIKRAGETARVAESTGLLADGGRSIPPREIQRQTYEAFGLRIEFDKVARTLVVSAMVTEAVAEAFENTKALRDGGLPVTVCDIAGAGFEPATFGL